jgi:hypothetical protein
MSQETYASFQIATFLHLFSFKTPILDDKINYRWNWAYSYAETYKTPTRVSWVV